MSRSNDLASGTDLSGYSTTSAINTSLALKAPLASPAFTGTPTGITGTHVGLGNVANESKATMFASPDFTGTVDLTGTTVSLDDDEISGDKVSGGTIGAGTFEGTVGSSAEISSAATIQGLAQRISDFAPDAIGTYGLLRRMVDLDAKSAGDEVSGNLSFANASGANSGAVNGTWALFGSIPSTTNGEQQTTLFMRVA